MRKLTEVEEAKALMAEAIVWSVMKWLREKKRVRKVANQANQALWAMQKEVKASWSGDLKSAYNELAAGDGNPGNSRPNPKADASALTAEVRQLARRVKQADDDAYRAHTDAEETFDKAEKILSTSLAREGCRKAIYSWELYEKAITKAEAGIVSIKTAK